MDITHNDAWLKAVIDGALEGIITIDEDDIVRSFNRGAERLFGYSAEEMIGSSISRLMPDSSARLHRSHMRRYLQTGASTVIGTCTEVTGLSRAGIEIPIELTVNEIWIGNRRLFAGVLRDVSSRKQAERALRESESHLREIASTLGEGVYVLDQDGRITFTNREAQKMLGWSESELLGQNAHAHFHHTRADGSAYPAADCEIGNVVRSRQFFRSSHEIFWRRDGTRLPVAVSSSPIIREEAVVGSVVAFHDISARLQAEQRLKRQTNLYAALGATSEAIIGIREQPALLQEVCRIAVEYGGFSMACVGMVEEDKPLPKPVAVLQVHSEARKEKRLCGSQCSLECLPLAEAIGAGSYRVYNHLAGDPPDRMTCSLVQSGGYRSGGVFPLRRGGQVIGALGFFAADTDYFDDELVELLLRMEKDISLALDNLDLDLRRHQAEEALRELNETLAQRVQEEVARNLENERLLIQQSRFAAMGEMIGNIAHQWRQPLNALGLVLANIQDAQEFGELDAQTLKDYVSNGRGLIEKMAATIDDFRNFFKPNKQKARFSVNRQVDHVLGLVNDSLKIHNIQVTRVESGEIWADGFPNEFSQVVLNVLMNAQDAFLERLIGNGRIVLTIHCDGADAIVEIADNAGGIPEDVLPKIFDPYFTTKEKGTGIGLYMSKMIVEHMGGRIDAGNTTDGAVITLAVPCGCAPA